MVSQYQITSKINIDKRKLEMETNSRKNTQYTLQNFMEIHVNIQYKQN